MVRLFKALLAGGGLMLACLGFSLNPTIADAAEGESIELQEYRGFLDVQPGDWYVTSGVLDYVIDNELMKGYSNSNKFGPYDTISRGQIATILYRIAGEPQANSRNFDDVNYSEYYGPAIRWARSAGVISGYTGTNNFGPNDPVTREQLAVMLANYTKEAAELSTSSNRDEGYDAYKKMADKKDVSKWAYSQILWALGNGIMSGDMSTGEARLNPKGQAQRCQVAKMISVLHRDVLFNFLIGTWKGDLVKTEPTGTSACYEGRNNPIEITFKSIDVPGETAQADIKVLVHKHWPNTNSEDHVVQLHDVTLDMNYIGFYNEIKYLIYTYEEIADYDIEMVIDPNQQVSIYVENGPYLGNHISRHMDRFTMIKQ